MLYSVITTIQEPTQSVQTLLDRLKQYNGRLIVAGDKKGPDHFNNPSSGDWPVEFLSLEDQLSGAFELSRSLPTGHYSRKNIAYLHAIQAGATCIYETDDDNAPTESWKLHEEIVSDCRIIERAEASRWVNVYKYFTAEAIWPRGLPLNEISGDIPGTQENPSQIRAPIQQTLADGSPDVDAVWRLVMDRPFAFDQAKSIYLAPRNWCPFNTQTTWWWPLAYPLLYVPSNCPFRMCDIWKSFVAQRCLWAMDLGIVFHASEVMQDRNEHNLMEDFKDEISGYTKNSEIADSLDSLDLSSKPDDIQDNMRLCYQKLIDTEIFPSPELKLLDLWFKDFNHISIA